MTEERAMVADQLHALENTLASDGLDSMAKTCRDARLAMEILTNERDEARREWEDWFAECDRQRASAVAAQTRSAQLQAALRWCRARLGDADKAALDGMVTLSPPPRKADAKIVSRNAARSPTHD